MRTLAALIMLVPVTSTDLLAQSSPVQTSRRANHSFRSTHSAGEKEAGGVRYRFIQTAILERATAVDPVVLPMLPAQPLDLRPNDALLHAGSSASIQLMGYGGLRALSVAQREALVISIGVTLAAGIGKELHDRAGHGDASTRDLFWDVVGTGIGVVLARFADR